MKNASPTIDTVGHSTRSLEELVAILRAHGVERVVDVRTIPRSRQLIADALTAHGFEVRDIMSPTSAKPHRLTPLAKVSGEQVTYPAEETGAELET